MGLISKIEDKLSGKHKTEDSTTLGSDSNTYGSSTNSGLTGSSNTYGSGNNSDLTGSNTTTGDSSLRHPVSGNQTSGLGHSGANTGYGSSTSNNPLSSSNQTSSLGHSGTSTGYGNTSSHNPLSSTTTTTNTTTGIGHSSGSHNPLSSNAGTHGTSNISSRDHVNRDGYGTEQHPSLRGDNTHGSVPGAYSGPAPNTAGPHNSDLLNKVDPRVDSDNSKLHNQTHSHNPTGTGAHGSHDTTHHGHSGHAQGFVPGSQAENPSAIPTAGGSKVGSDNDGYGTHSSSTRGNETVGPHKSDTLNKLDPRVDSDNSKLHDHDRNTYGTPGNTYGTSGHYNTTSGPHGNDTLNRADPRVDSDNSRSQHHYGRDAAIGGAGVGAGAYGADHLGRNEPYGTTGGSHHTAGPHSNDTLNRVDPRVDSDNSRAYGTSGNTYGSSGHHNTTAGPHSNNTLNRADPRVDSDNSRAYGHDNTIGGAGVGSGAYPSSHSGPNTTSGPHHTDTANRVDPRVGSDNSRSHGYSSTNEPYGSSTHNKETVGPHKSDLLNKLDPRVDSDQSKLRRDDDLSCDTGNLSLNDRHAGNTGYGSNTTTGGGYGGSSNTGTSDITHGRKLGGAYEAGYKDALAHLEAERHGN